MIEAFNIFKGSSSGLCSRLKAFAVNAFPFAREWREALHGSMIRAVAWTTHTDLNTVLLQNRLIALSGIRTATIRMMH